MIAKLYILFVCIITVLPCISSAEQYSKNQTIKQTLFAELEKNVTVIKAQSEKNVIAIKTQSEKNATAIKTQSEKNATAINVQSKQDPIVAMLKRNTAITKAQLERNTAITNAQLERNTASTQAQLERNAATQIAATTSAVNADNGLSDKNSWLKAITEKFNAGLKGIKEEYNALDRDINESYSHCGSEKSRVQRTFTQLQEIGTATLYGYSFNTACQAHDACYDDCITPKLECDGKLLADAERVCESAFLKAECISLANSYYNAVTGSGYADTAFKNARANCPAKPVAKQSR
jgi:hypothetical protein